MPRTPALTFAPLVGMIVHGAADKLAAVHVHN